MRMRWISAAVAVLMGIGGAAIALGEKFTLAVIPDTQQEISAEGDRFAQRAQWLVEQKEKLNLKMVLHSGDLINWDTPGHEQLQKASAGLEILDKAQIPYAIALGNHDTAAVKVGGSAAPGNVNANLRTTAAFNSCLPAARFKNLQGVFEKDKVDNAWHAFTAGGLNWMVLNLELWPRKEAVAWAAGVIEAHPTYNVILLTHCYLDGNSAIWQTSGGYGDSSPQYVFDTLVKPHANVKFVFSGHVGAHGYLKSETAGGSVHQFLQSFHSRTSNPTRLVEIDTEKNQAKTWIYYPLTHETKEDGSAIAIDDAHWVGGR